MKKRLYFALLLFLTVSTLDASVKDYQQLYAEEQQAFSKEMSEEIKKQLPKAHWKVKRMYQEINYQPVWVDKDYLTHYSELLIKELEDDFKKGHHKKLVKSYKKLIPDANHVFASDSLADKAKVEIGIMKLYIDTINDILKNKKSKYTALTLLQKALAEKSMVSALNAISDERIMHHVSNVDLNITAQKEKEEARAELVKRLMGEDKKERLKAMYALVAYKAIWINEKGLTSYAKELFEQIDADITFEHNSTTYRTYQTLKNATVPTEKEAISKREFELSALYQDYMSHLLYGDINWKKFLRVLHGTRRHGVWVVHNILASPESLLIGSLKSKTLTHAFEEAKPKFPMYERMLTAVTEYQKMVDNGGWEKLGDFENLKPGKRSSIVPKLRARLASEGDYQSCKNTDENSTHYDDCLLKAVKKFQARHGLEAEGFVGPMTRKALNTTAEEKLAGIKLNIDRLKWLKRGDDKHHIFVNIPSYTMYMFDGYDIIQQMRVITGRKGHETPIFHGRVRTVVVNPYWRIPASIIRHETIPKLKKDPGYTNKKKIEIHTGYSEHSPRVNPYNVNWHKYGKRLPPYRFMQSPGEQNALGKVKYLFPNKYAVYMHDTNQRYLFTKDYRALSHGCVRLHKPFELFETLANIEPNIDFSKFQGILDKNKKTPYRLAKSIPVDIVYLTTLVDKDGTVIFSDDVYGYDKMQMDTMK